MFSLSFKVLFILLFCKAFSTEFKWVKDDSFFDCVVGITLDNKPIGMGVFYYSPYLILTTASPLHHKSWTNYEGNLPDSSLGVHVINGEWNKSRSVEVNRVTGNQFNRNGQAWVKVGEDSRHTTVYDFFIIVLEEQAVMPWDASPGYRAPYTPKNFNPSIHMEDTARNYQVYSPSGWKFAAFAYNDRNHVEESTQLLPTYCSSEMPLEDCDEWIPRPWGHFICLRNIDNYVGIQSGAVLFNDDTFFGLGAFEVTKGNESILVFTYMFPHRYGLRAYRTITESPKLRLGRREREYFSHSSD